MPLSATSTLSPDAGPGARSGPPGRAAAERARASVDIRVGKPPMAPPRAEPGDSSRPGQGPRPSRLPYSTVKLVA